MLIAKQSEHGGGDEPPVRDYRDRAAGTGFDEPVEGGPDTPVEAAQALPTG